MLSIALIGPDGCGKTTVANKIEQALPWPATRVYMGVSLESSNIMLPTSRLKLALRRVVGRPADTTGPRDPHQREKAPQGRHRGLLTFVTRSLSFVNQVAEESFRQCVVAWHLARGRIVLLDRDFFADYYAYDIAGQDRSVFRRLHGWLLLHVYRKPDLAIYLDVSGETMFARKGEGSIELLNRRCEDYRHLQYVMPNFAIVDAEQPLANVVRDVQQHIGRLLRERQARVTSGAASEMPLAVVIGADCVTGLQSGRSLARHQIPVLGIAANVDNYCCRTNVFQRILQGGTHGHALIELLHTLGPTLSAKAVLFPCTDLGVLTISEHRATLEPWYHFALPDHETIFTLTDKLAFARHAEQHGIPFPRFRSLESSADARAAARELIFPCYLKPALKTTDWEEHTKIKTFVVHTPAELLDTYRMCSAWTNRLLVQEAILGPTQDHYTRDLYFGKDGAALASFGSRKLRRWPLETGTGCLSVEEDSEELRAKALRVFRDTQFHGLAYVEMKRDSRSGDDLVIETNVGRPTGRSAAATRSGIDLLYTMYCDLLNLPAPVNHPKKAAGRKWIHLRRDLLASATLWKTGQLSLREWCRSVSGPKHFAVFSFRDPKPFLAESKRYLGELLFSKKHRRSRETPGR